MLSELHLKYRPSNLDEVVGHESVIKSIRDVLAKGTARAFLFIGPSGVGKTTLARAIASELKCTDVVEVDAATHTGVDAMRNLTSSAGYMSLMGGNGLRVIIVDECHRLSTAAWESLLKIIEEPPANLVWMLCTTDPSKVKQTIKTRCVTYDLKPLRNDDILYIMDTACVAEEIELDDDVVDLIIDHANGSPRQALVDVSACASLSFEEASEVLAWEGGSIRTVELCKMLANSGFQDPGVFKKALKIVSTLKENNVDPEGIRKTIINYLAVVFIKDSKSDRQWLTFVLDNLSEPFTDTDKYAPIALALGKIHYGG